MGFCNCVMFCCAILYVHSSIAIILIGKIELVGLLFLLSSWCLLIVVRIFLTVHGFVCSFLILVLPDHTHLLFITDTTYQDLQFVWHLVSIL